MNDDTAAEGGAIDRARRRIRLLVDSSGRPNVDGRSLLYADASIARNGHVVLAAEESAVLRNLGLLVVYEPRPKVRYGSFVYGCFLLSAVGSATAQLLRGT